ncbi:MAG: pentapeptide repeat-containing protein [Candidatus Caenarcaniphilales bacterium]|nr:pentapeptide repeat-containing protein [Candidatus Caenarcaniphilales bacterium]
MSIFTYKVPEKVFHRTSGDYCSTNLDKFGDFLTHLIKLKTSGLATKWINFPMDEDDFHRASMFLFENNTETEGLLKFSDRQAQQIFQHIYEAKDNFLKDKKEYAHTLIAEIDAVIDNLANDTFNFLDEKIQRLNKVESRLYDSLLAKYNSSPEYYSDWLTGNASDKLIKYAFKELAKSDKEAYLTKKVDINISPDEKLKLKNILIQATLLEKHNGKNDNNTFSLEDTLMKILMLPKTEFNTDVLEQIDLWQGYVKDVNAALNIAAMAEELNPEAGELRIYLKAFSENFDKLSDDAKAKLKIFLFPEFYPENLSITNDNLFQGLKEGDSPFDQDWTDMQIIGADFTQIEKSKKDSLVYRDGKDGEYAYPYLNFTGSNLTETSFEKLDMENYKLANTNLTQVNFKGTNLIGADLSGAHWDIDEDKVRLSARKDWGVESLLEGIFNRNKDKEKAPLVNNKTRFIAQDFDYYANRNRQQLANIATKDENKKESFIKLQKQFNEMKPELKDLILSKIGGLQKKVIQNILDINFEARPKLKIDTKIPGPLEIVKYHDTDAKSLSDFRQMNKNGSSDTLILKGLNNSKNSKTSYFIHGKDFRPERFSKPNSLVGVKISEEDVRGANFTGQNLSRSVINRLNAQGANFSQVDLSEAKIYNSNLSGVDFSEAKMNGTEFVNCQLDKTQWEQAVLNNVDMKNCTINDVEINQIKVNGWTLNHCVVDNLQLKGEGSGVQMNQLALIGTAWLNGLISGNTLINNLDIFGSVFINNDPQNLVYPKDDELIFTDEDRREAEYLIENMNIDPVSIVNNSPIQIKLNAVEDKRSIYYEAISKVNQMWSEYVYLDDNYVFDPLDLALIPPDAIGFQPRFNQVIE